MLQPGTTLDHDRYRVGAVIGRGGFGYVYRARERLTGETVAIKELVPSFVDDQHMVQRFIQEARATLRLTHPHIARTHGIFVDRGTYYLAMEYLPGGSLADRLKQGPLPVEEAVRIASDLCDALAYAHDKGVIHCDIKPANVLFDETGDVRLADFGIAHVSADMMTRQFFTASGMAMGTVQYMAPEQLSGVRDDRRVDIYAMGVLLYRTLAGRSYLDFKTETTPAAQAYNITLIQHQSPRPLRQMRPDVPQQLAKTVERALRKTPDDRFSTAEGLQDALRGMSPPQSEQQPLPSAQMVSGRESKPASEKDELAVTPSLLDRLTAWLKAIPAWRGAVGALAVVALLIGGGMWLQRVIGGNSAPERPATATLRPPSPTRPMPTATAGAHPTSVHDGEQILKLGILGPFSGPASRTGDEFRGAVEMAFDGIGWRIGDYEIEPVWIDSQSNPATAYQNYEEAILQDGVEAGLLNWHASVAVSCMEAVADHQIPHFASCGATKVINETWRSDPDRYFYWVNKWWPTPDRLSISYVQMLEHAIDSGLWSPESKTVAIYGEDTDWGRDFRDGIAARFEEAGWEIVATEYFGISETEFYPLLNKFKDLNPAVVAGTSTAAPSLSAFIKQADEVGLESVIICDGLGWHQGWYDSTGEASNYVLDQNPRWVTEEGQQFAADFEMREGFAPSPSAGGMAYDAANYFIQAAQSVYQSEGKLTSDTLADFAKNQIQTGAWSYTDGIMMEEYVYTPETAPDPVVGQGYYMFPVIQYFDGEGRIVFAPNWGEQPFTYR